MVIIILQYCFILFDTSGSLNGVLSEQQYSRAMVCHKSMLETLERLLVQECMKNVNKDDLLSAVGDVSKQVLYNMLEMPTKTSLNTAVLNRDCIDLVDQLTDFKAEVRSGKFGKTAQLWITYVGHIWMILTLIQAVENNNLPLYIESLYLMADLFLSFGGQNYARYLTLFAVFLANIEESHPGATQLLEGGAISVARSLIPGNRCPVDKTIKETFMKQSKSHGGAGGCGAGLTGLVNDYRSYQRWVRTAHERSQFVQATLSMADMLSESDSVHNHKGMRPTEIKKNEKSW